MENEVYKIRTKNGRITTLTIEAVTSSQYIGIDKFGKHTIIPISDIVSMYPVNKMEWSK